jgi:parallel beta-helix repeat protein
MRKRATLLLVLVLTVSSIVSALPVNAEYSDNITIGADGNVSPSTAPLKQAGNVYSLTSNFSGTITVNNNNMVLDGNSHSLTVPPIFGYGVTLNGVSNVTVTNFIITGGAIGINVNGTSNIIANNTIHGADNWIYSIAGDPTAGIAVMDASSNVITRNNLENCTVGINLISWHSKQCTNNEIVENNFTCCSNAIAVFDSSNNRIYHNNFFDNKVLLHDTGYYGYSLPSFNVWDDGNLFGNYWSDYQVIYPYATEINNTGVGDTPYFVKPNHYVDLSKINRQEARDYWAKTNFEYKKNTDHFPLMQPFNFDNYLLRTTPPKISLLSPMNQTYGEPGASLVFNVSKPFSWIGYSLDGKENVTITGNTTIADLPNGLHNVTIYAKDTFGNMGASQTISFTVSIPDPFPALPVAVSVAVVAVFVAGLLQET